MAPCQAVQHPLAGDGARRDFSAASAEAEREDDGAAAPLKIKEQKDRMDRALLGDVELAYEVHGGGEPVTLGSSRHLRRLVHAAAPRAGPHRDATASCTTTASGSAGSSRVAGPVSLAQQAAHGRLLMQRLGVARAHVVGHSSSGNIALQLALDAPERRSVARGPRTRADVGAKRPDVESIRRNGCSALPGGRQRPEPSIPSLRGTCGPGYRAALDRALPGAFDQHVADADTFFEQELPALQQWSFRQEDAQRVIQPVLAVVGARSLELDPIWGERQQLLLDWLPNAEPFVLPDSTHLLQVENPRGVAERLAAFFADHAITVAG